MQRIAEKYNKVIIIKTTRTIAERMKPQEKITKDR